MGHGVTHEGHAPQNYKDAHDRADQSGKPRRQQRPLHEGEFPRFGKKVNHAYDTLISETIMKSIMLVVRVIHFRRTVRVGMVLNGIGLAVEMHHEQVGAKGRAKDLLVQHLRRLTEGDQPPV